VKKEIERGLERIYSSVEKRYKKTDLESGEALMGVAEI
jgi:hypothetical protein